MLESLNIDLSGMNVFTSNGQRDMSFLHSSKLHRH